MLELVDSPDRLNIKLYASKFKSTISLYELFDWLISKILEEEYATPRIMIFCRSITDCGRLHVMFLSKLLNCHRLHNLIAMYHSNTLDSIKAEIEKDMCDSNGNIRILICTSAAGMGINFSVVNHVIHFGPSYNTDSFIQQMGRAGRDNTQSHHLLLWSSRQLKNVDVEMIDYMRAKECRRHILMNLYGGMKHALLDLHLCCDNCADMCSCAKTECALYKKFPLFDTHECNSDDSDVGDFSDVE
jgi:ATP-dependent DNA helicase RecQ